MSQEIRLNLQFVIEEVEDILQEYPEYPYQAAFAIPELRQKLITYVLSLSNNHRVIENARQPLKITNYLYPSLEQRLPIEVLIRGGILHLLRENADWLAATFIKRKTQEMYPCSDFADL